MYFTKSRQCLYLIEQNKPTVCKRYFIKMATLLIVYGCIFFFGIKILSKVNNVDFRYTK